MAGQVVFHGTCAERDALLVALERACSCPPEAHGREHCCPAHAMLHDQRTLDRLLFARYLREQLRAREFRV